MTPPLTNSIASLQFPEGFKILEMITSGYKRHMILISALKTGIFDYLEKTGGSTREGIVTSLPLCGMLSRSYLNTLISMDLLSLDRDLYKNTWVAKEFLVKTSPYYQGDLISGSSMHGSRWDLLTEAMQSSDGTVQSTGPGPSPHHLNTLAQRAIQGEAQNLIKWISDLPDFSERKKILDIGGGHGLFSIGLCQMNPDLHAVILDQPHVIGITRSYIIKYGLEEQVVGKAGDIRTESYKPEYDIILISHLLYKFRTDLDEILRLVSEGLKPGGILISNHWFCSPGCIPMQDSISELEMSLQSAGHPLCHPESFEALFKKYGLTCIRTGTLDTAFGPSQLHAAEKLPL
ncbi:MAG: class I SAM-dependent methyltransferase [Methanobacteriota archaeon]